MILCAHMHYQSAFAHLENYGTSRPASANELLVCGTYYWDAVVTADTVTIQLFKSHFPDQCVVMNDIGVCTI